MRKIIILFDFDTGLTGLKVGEINYIDPSSQIVPYFINLPFLKKSDLVALEGRMERVREEVVKYLVWCYYNPS